MRFKLTDKKIKALDKSKAQKIADGGGLYVYTRPNGAVFWRFRYRLGGRRQEIQFGAYPEISLAEAREWAGKISKQLRWGLDPKTERKKERRESMQNNFKSRALEWLAKKEKTVSASRALSIRSYVERDLIPLLGGADLDGLKAPDLVRAFDEMGRKGANALRLKRCRETVGQFFRWAMARGYVEADPSVSLNGVFPAPKSGHFTAPQKPEEVGAILRRLDEIDADGAAASLIAARLLPLVAVRVGELISAKWEDIDFNTREWRFIAPKTGQAHLVPLSRQAVALFERMRDFGPSKWVFPSPLLKGKPLSHRAVYETFRRVASKEEATLHGWRSVFRTMGAERLGISGDVLEAQLGHRVRDPLGRAYNRADWFTQRRDAMQQWADYLDKLKGKA